MTALHPGSEASWWRPSVFLHTTAVSIPGTEVLSESLLQVWLSTLGYIVVTQLPLEWSDSGDKDPFRLEFKLILGLVG